MTIDYDALGAKPKTKPDKTEEDNIEMGPPKHDRNPRTGAYLNLAEDALLKMKPVVVPVGAEVNVL